MEAVGFVGLKDNIHTKPLQIHMPLEIHRFSTLRKIPIVDARTTIFPQDFVTIIT